MYKLGELFRDTNSPVCIWRLSDMASIPFDPANTDYQTFKTDISNGAELQNHDGDVMTAKEVKAFMATLPADESDVVA